MKKEVTYFKTEKERLTFLRGKHKEIPAVEYVKEESTTTTTPPKRKRKKKDDEKVQTD